MDADASAADKLQTGDVIEHVNQKPIASVAEYKETMKNTPEDGTVALSILRGRQRSLVVLNGE